MIRGVVSPRREAAVPLTVYGMAGSRVVVTATVDTGFNGLLTLPPATVASLRLPFKKTRTSILADGRAVTFAVYAGLIDWHGVPRAVEVDAANSEPLVGMKLLADSELWMACQPGGAVEITQTLPPPPPAP